MPTINKFEDLEIWQLARELNKTIWLLTMKQELKNHFHLNEQLRKASISIMNNISEGFDRDGNKEFIQFLSIAKGSAGEVKNMLYALSDIGMISQSEFEGTSSEVEKIKNKIGKLMNYLKDSELKGKKFKTFEHKNN